MDLYCFGSKEFNFTFPGEFMSDIKINACIAIDIQPHGN